MTESALLFMSEVSELVNEKELIPHPKIKELKNIDSNYKF